MDDQDFHFFFGGASVWDIVIVYGLLVDEALGFVPVYRIALKFRGSKFLRITGHSRNYFNENFDKCCAPTATRTVFQRTCATLVTASLMALFVYFNSEDGQ